MRLALFTETFLPKIDGIVRTLCPLLEYLEANGHETLVFAPKGAPASYAGAKVIGLRGYTFPMYPELKLVSPLVDVQRSLQAFQPDLIHVAGPVSLGIAGIRCGHRLNIPVVASYHTDVPGFAKRWGYDRLVDPLWSFLRWVHNQVDLTVCPSGVTLRELEAHRFERLAVWSGGVDAELFHPQRRSDEWRNQLTDGHPEATLLLSVGRLAAEKRVHWLREVLDAIPGTRLAIVGGGPHRAHLEEVFAGTPTVFVGYLSGTDLASAYASADLFVFPAANETFGNVVVEAMASGLPVVAANSGGPLEIIQHGKTGWFFEAEDPTTLIEVVRGAIEHADQSAIRQAAREEALTRSWGSVNDQLMDHYERLIANRRGKEYTYASEDKKTYEFG